MTVCVFQTFCLLRLENCYYIFIDLSVSLKDNLIIITILLNECLKDIFSFYSFIWSPAVLDYPRDSEE